MSKELLEANEYCVIAFSSTQHALAAEAVLQEKVSFVVIPTPRDISANCGLALKLYPTDTQAVIKALTEGSITWSGLYAVRKNGKDVVTKQLS